MDKQKRNILPRRKSDMTHVKDNIYKYFLGFISTVGVGALIWIANDTTQIKAIVYGERVITGKMGRDVENNTKQFLTYKKETNNRLNKVEERIISHAISDAARTYNTITTR